MAIIKPIYLGGVSYIHELLSFDSCEVLGINVVNLFTVCNMENV
jgi:hypothetical protein